MKERRILPRVVAMLLALVMMAALLAVPALAAKSYNKNRSFEVETGKAPWYLCWQAPQITIRNTGSQPITAIVYDSNGRIYKQITSLKAERKTTFNLKGKKSYTLAVTANALHGGKPNYEITTRHIVDMW